MSSPLLPLRPGFVARLDAARELGWRFFRDAAAPGAPGAPPEEFEGHHPYTPGDDVRWIDWNLYARQEALFVKVFRAAEEVEVLLLVDASPSMTGGDGRKHRAAAAAAAALARLALVTGHPVRIARYGERLLDVRGPWRSPEYSADAQHFLAQPPPAACGTDLGQALEALCGSLRRPACIVVLTDGFQPEALTAAVSRELARGARRFVLVRVANPSDLSPRLRGHTVLLDSEGGGSRRIVADSAFEQTARRRIVAHVQRLLAEATRLGAACCELPLQAPFEEAFLSLLRGVAGASGP